MWEKSDVTFCGKEITEKNVSRECAALSLGACGQVPVSWERETNGVRGQPRRRGHRTAEADTAQTSGAPGAGRETKGPSLEPWGHGERRRGLPWSPGTMTREGGTLPGVPGLQDQPSPSPQEAGGPSPYLLVRLLPSRLRNNKFLFSVSWIVEICRIDLGI